MSKGTWAIIIGVTVGVLVIGGVVLYKVSDGFKKWLNTPWTSPDAQRDRPPAANGAAGGATS